MHTGEDFEETECKDYVGRLSAALIRHAFNVTQPRGALMEHGARVEDRRMGN